MTAHGCALAVAVLLVVGCGRIKFDGEAPRDVAEVCDELALSMGLRGHWSFDEGAGLTAADAAAGHDGDLINGPTWTAGRHGGALVFDGVDDHVEIRDDIAYAFRQRPITFSAWFLLADYQTTTPDIMQIRSDTPSPWHVLMSSKPEYFGISIGSGDNVWMPIKTGIQPELGVWHHILVTFDGADSTVISSYHVFLDGAEQPLEPAVGYASQAQQSRIGAAELTSNQWFGSIDDVRIYDRVVETGHVAQLAAGCH